MDVCIENVFPAVATPFNPFQRDPREDRNREDKRRKPDTSDSKVVADIGPLHVDALFASVKAGTDDPEVLDELIEYLSERLGIALREAGQRARTMGVQIRYMDQFSARQTLRLMRPSNDECELLAEARELFTLLFKRRVPIQVLSLSATNLEPCSRQEELRAGELALGGAQPFEGKRAAPLRLAARVGLR